MHNKCIKMHVIAETNKRSPFGRGSPKWRVLEIFSKVDKNQFLKSYKNKGRV